MLTSEITKTLRILSDGGVKVGEKLIIDGHDRVPYRIVTHIHSDHTIGLEKSIVSKSTLVATPLTMEWLKALGYNIRRNQELSLNYGEEVRIGNLTVTLQKTLHIPGSAQVVIDSSDGRIVYTSDFKKPGIETPILSADILVIDAVYGRSDYVRSFDDTIDMILADLVKELLSQGPVYIYAYYGKVQEVMALLRDYDINAPFIVTQKNFRLCRIAERFGFKFGDYVLAGTPDSEDIIRDGWYVYFSHISRRINGIGNHIVLSGWEFKYPYKRLGSKYWLVAFSDHADFKGLIRYIEDSKPRELIINRVRSVGAEDLANYVRKKLGIKAYLLP